MWGADTHKWPPSPHRVIFSIFILSVYRRGLEDRVGSETCKKKRENREVGGEAAEPYLELSDSVSPPWLGQEWGAQNTAGFGLLMRNSRAGSQRVGIIEVTNAVQYR